MVEPNEIDTKHSLVDQGVIDSFGLVEISSFIKKIINISIHEQKLNNTNFGSVDRLVTFIEEKLSIYFF